LIEQNAGFEILKEYRLLKGFMEFYEGGLRLFEGRIEKGRNGVLRVFRSWKDGLRFSKGWIEGVMRLRRFER